MSLLHAVRIGSQRPRLSSLPANRRASVGPEAIELAALAGLVLDDWQQWVLTNALAEQDDFQWSAFEVALIVARQCGKGSILEARQLAGLALLAERLQVHTSHEFKTCFEHFLRMVNLAESCPEVDRQIMRIRRGAGEQSIEMRSGARLRFIARSGGSGRGMSGDTVYLDEAFALTAPMMGALLPTLSARPNPQIWYTSSAPLSTSVVLHGVRDRGIEGKAPRLLFAEWSAPAGSAPDDTDAWYQANPALGIRIDENFVRAELDALSNTPDEFLRERLGIPDPLPSEIAPDPKLDQDKWMATEIDVRVPEGGPHPHVKPGECTMAYDIHNGWSSVSIASGSLAGSYVEVMQWAPGDGWLGPYLVDKFRTWRPTKIGLDGTNGPAVAALGVIREAFEDAGLRTDVLEPLTAGAHKAACGGMFQAVTNGTVQRPRLPDGEDQLRTAGLKASERVVGNSFDWDRKAPGIPLATLESATVARALLPEKAAAEFFMY